MLRRAFIVLGMMLCVAFCRHAPAAPITLVGPVPPGIDTAGLRSEYHRIVSLVSDRRLDHRAPLTIIYYSSRRAPNLSVRLPEWGGGGTLGPDTIIVPVDSPLPGNRNIRQTTVHEMVHAALLRAYPHPPIPRWFHEGCAMTLSGELSLSQTLVLARAIIAGKLPALAAIDSVNLFSAPKAHLAYSQSHAVFLLLLEVYGIETVPKLLAAARRKGSFARGMQRVLGITPAEFEHLAIQHLRKRYGLATILGDFYLVWLLILTLAIAAFVMVQRRNQRKAAAMADMHDELPAHGGKETESRDDSAGDDTSPPRTPESPAEPPRP